MGYLVPPPPPLIRPGEVQRPRGTAVRMVRPLEGDPIRQPIRQGPSLLPPPTGPIPGRPGQAVGVAFDPLGGINDAIRDALARLVPLPTLPAPLTEDWRDEWPRLFPAEEA